MKKIVIGLAAAVVAAVVPLSTAWAGGYPVTTGGLTVEQNGQTTNPVAPGSTVTVSGEGFASGATVGLDIQSTPTSLGTTTAGGSGSISATVTIPSSISAGPHTISATGVSPSGATLVLSAQVTVAIEGALPLTGGNMLALVGAALAATAVGWLLVVVTRPTPKHAA